MAGIRAHHERRRRLAPILVRPWDRQTRETAFASGWDDDKTIGASWAWHALPTTCPCSRPTADGGCMASVEMQTLTQACGHFPKQSRGRGRSERGGLKQGEGSDVAGYVWRAVQEDTAARAGQVDHAQALSVGEP
jgi:hypothetical protein